MDSFRVVVGPNTETKIVTMNGLNTNFHREDASKEETHGSKFSSYPLFARPNRHHIMDICNNCGLKEVVQVRADHIPGNHFSPGTGIPGDSEICPRGSPGMKDSQ